jgi:hypothetical protein
MWRRIGRTGTMPVLGGAQCVALPAATADDLHVCVDAAGSRLADMRLHVQLA